MKISSQCTFIDNNNEFWIPAYNHNVLCHISSDGETEIIGSFNHYKVADGWVVSKVLEHNKYLYFFSANGPEYWVLDIDSNELSYRTYTNDLTFIPMSFIECDNDLYITPRFSTKPIIKLELLNERPNISFTPNITTQDSSLTYATIYTRRIYFCSRTENNIYFYAYDIDTQNIIEKKLSDLHFVKNVSVNENGIYVVGRGKNNDSLIIEIAHSSFEIVTKKSFEDNKFIRDDMFILHSIALNDRIIFASPYTNEGLMYDVHSGNMTKLLSDEKHIVYPCENYSMQIYDNEVYFSSITGDYLWGISLETLQVQTVEYNINSGIISEYLLSKPEKKSVLKEEKCFSLDYLVSIINQNNADLQSDYKKVGKDIYNLVKR